MELSQASGKQWFLNLLRSGNFSLRTRRIITAYVFLTPALVYFTIFYFLPLGLEFWASLRTGQPLVGSSNFAGLHNYLRAFQDPRALNSFQVTFLFSLGYTVFGVTAGLALALMLNQKIPGRVPLRAILFFPYMTTFVIVALMWANILDPYIGILNNALNFLNLPTQTWLASTGGALPALIGITIWHTAGYNMVLFLAGLQGIPNEFYEAAKIDGASAWARFWNITLPLLAPATLFVSIISVINSLQAFAQAYIITRGGPADATRLFVYHIFNIAFTEVDFGYASAQAFLMLLVILALTMIQFRFGERELEY